MLAEIEVLRQRVLLRIEGKDEEIKKAEDLCQLMKGLKEEENLTRELKSEIERLEADGRTGRGWRRPLAGVSQLHPALSEPERGEKSGQKISSGWKCSGSKVKRTGIFRTGWIKLSRV